MSYTEPTQKKIVEVTTAELQYSLEVYWNGKGNTPFNYSSQWFILSFYSFSEQYFIIMFIEWINSFVIKNMWTLLEKNTPWGQKIIIFLWRIRERKNTVKIPSWLLCDLWNSLVIYILLLKWQEDYTVLLSEHTSVV